MSKKMKLEEIKGIINQVDGVKVDSFSGLVAQLGLIPGIKTIKFKDDKSGLLPVLAALFDSGDSAGPQSITLEVRYPQNYCEEHDYEVGFHLGSKWAQLGHGWFHDVVRAINARSKAPTHNTIVPTTMIIKSATTS